MNIIHKNKNKNYKIVHFNLILKLLIVKLQEVVIKRKIFIKNYSIMQKAKNKKS